MNPDYVPLEEIGSFGELVKFLRRRAQISQRELSIAVGYSESQISRIESNQRIPGRSSLLALFVPALSIEAEPGLVRKLLELADASRPVEQAGAGQPQPVLTSPGIQPEIHSHLPAQLTSFVGRQEDLAELCCLLGGQQTRLLTLTGEGGCGKTRLALRAGEVLAENYSHGAWLVELGPLSTPDLLIQSVSHTFGMAGSAGSPLLPDLLNFLQNRRMLLILDNCEHLVAACARLADTLLRACPGLQILATSREPLGVSGEVTFRVLPLSLPSMKAGAALTPAEVEAYEAIQLFVERGKQFQRGFHLTVENASAIARICRRLDGIPLAIELAAARLNMLQPEQIARRLEEDIDMLVSSTRVPDLSHHRTLRSAMDWSYNLLDEAERILLRHLAVFSNGCTLDAAEWMAQHVIIPHKQALDVLNSLVNKSLVRVEQAGNLEARYRLLETIQTYLAEKLAEKNETVPARDSHLAYFCQLAGQSEAGLKGPQQADWLDRLEQERDNIRSAFSWCIETAKTDEGLQLAGDLSHYWWMVGNRQESQGWYEALLPAAGSDDVLSHSTRYAKALYGYAVQLSSAGDVNQAKSVWVESLRIYQQHQDDAGSSMVLCWLGAAQENLAAGLQLLNQGLKLGYQAEDDWWIAETLH